MEVILEDSVNGIALWCGRRSDAHDTMKGEQERGQRLCLVGSKV